MIGIMQGIIVLKKVEKPDKTLRLELVIDKKVPVRSKLEGIVSDPVLTAKFQPLDDRNSMHSFFLDHTDVFDFLRVLASIKSNDWIVFTSNAYVAASAEVVQTFYFERTSNADTQSGNRGGDEVSYTDTISKVVPTPKSGITSVAATPKLVPPEAEVPTSQPSSNRLPGPPATAVVTIGGKLQPVAATTSVNVDSPAISNHGATTVNNPVLEGSVARRSSIQSSLSALTASGDSSSISPAASDATGAVARRTSISSSLSSLSSGDAYLFARKIAERGK